MYSVDIKLGKGYSCAAKSKGYEFLIDPKGSGITPPDTLLAALGACIAVYIRKYAEGAKLELDEVDIKVESEFTKERPVCFRTIKVQIDLKSARIDERRKRALIQFVKNCPVHNTLKANTEIELTT